MEALSVTGGVPLHGSVQISGAKNAVLPILAACVRHGGRYVLRNCPDISDVRLALEIIELLGGMTERRGTTLHINTVPLEGWQIPAELMERMRASVLFLGALLARFGKVRLTLPGGCPLGRRPIDLHLEVMSGLGAAVTLHDGEIFCQGQLHGGEICFPFPSVGATENFLLAATACHGTAILRHGAAEPEVVDLANFLAAMGADIRGIGTDEITVRGGASLCGADYTILPDRMETATYLCAAAACGGNITLEKTNGELLLPVLDALQQAGCAICLHGDQITLRSEGRLQAVPELMTGPYPRFPTDAQAPFLAAMLRAKGQCMLTETVFDNRFAHVEAFLQFGASARRNGPTVRICGVEKLHGAAVAASDLRGAAALIIAALQTEEKSLIFGLNHLDRGYDNPERKLRALGASVFREAQ